MQINPYLYFNGKCEEAFRFYELILNGKIEFIMRYDESPMADKTPPELSKYVTHATLRFGNSVVMGADAPAQRYTKPQGFSVSINLTHVSEAERIFKELSAGGTVVMPLEKTFWAERFGMFTDRFGTPWMINCPQAA
jgi:PhnB protein